MPEVIDNVKLTPAQVAAIEECAGKVKGVKDPYAVCVASFKRAHKIVGTGDKRRWEPKKESEAKA